MQGGWYLGDVEWIIKQMKVIESMYLSSYSLIMEKTETIFFAGVLMERLFTPFTWIFWTLQLPFAIKIMNIYFLSFRQARQKNKKPFCFHRHLIQLAYFLHPELCELTTIIYEERYIWDKCFVNSMMKNKYVFLSVGFRYIRLFMLKKRCLSFLIFCVAVFMTKLFEQFLKIMTWDDERGLSLLDIKIVYMRLKNSAYKSICCCNE